MEFKENIKQLCPASSGPASSTSPASSAPVSPPPASPAFESPSNPAGLKEKIKKTCRVRNVILFCLILLFLWWGSNSVVKYWSQPLSTDISFRYGNSELGIQFPLITLCQGNIFIENPTFKECHDGSWNFISTVASCMKSNKTFNVIKVNHSHPDFIQNTCLCKHIHLEILKSPTIQLFLSDLS